MKIWGNIRSGYKLARSVLKYNKDIPKIEGPRARGDFEEERRAIADLTVSWVNDLMDIFDLSLDVNGRENIPDGPCVFIANHQGYCDIPALMKALEGHPVGFIAKASFKPVPILAKWITLTRGLFIPTDGADTRESLRIINQGVELIGDGFSLAIFPEGRRSWSSTMGELKPGSFKLATKSKVPIVPVTIDGTYHVFEEHQKITSGQHVVITIHPAIETANMGRAEQKNLHTKVEEIIRSALPNQGRP